MSKVIITGAAGFIGYHMAVRLCADGHDVHGMDNLNDYYDVSLKDARLAQLEPLANFTFTKCDLADREAVTALFESAQPEIVIHLGAQAGVRYSLENPHAYIDSNVTGTLNILEGCRAFDVKHLLYASSSSVYGANTKTPFAISDNVDNPVSLYAATKKSNELMAHSYAHLYGIPTTGLRFFTVYGPWGRPDMAYFKFANAMQAGRAIDVYNHGDMRRDFTYIDDIIEAIARLIPLKPEAADGKPPYALYNIGGEQPEQLMDLISLLVAELGIEAQKNMLPMQAGDVYETYADASALSAAVGFAPQITLKDGIARFVDWYLEYYDA